MVTGELDYDTLFNLGMPQSMEPDPENDPVPYRDVSFVMWIIFLVLIPIILNNLLVSVVHEDVVSHSSHPQQLVMHAYNSNHIAGLIHKNNLTNHHCMRMCHSQQLR